MPKQTISDIRKILRNSFMDDARLQPAPNGVDFHIDGKTKISFQHTPTSKIAEILKAKSPPNFGVILDTIAERTKKELESKDISYISLEGDVYFSLERKIVKIENVKPKKTKVSKKNANPIEGKLPAPTDFISPYGLEILDALFRIPNHELSHTTPYRFCKDFHLNHARLFKMLSSIGTKDLVDFKDATCKLPQTWWRQAFAYPRTNQRLHSFQRNSESYVSFALDNSIETFQAIEETRLKYGDHAVVLGPAEMLKHLGYISSEDLQLWIVGDEALKNIKRLLKLTPAILGARGMRVFTSKIKDEKELTSQCILSRVSQYGELNSETRELNYFRAIWDACNGDSRLQSGAMDLLKERILK